MCCRKTKHVYDDLKHINKNILKHYKTLLKHIHVYKTYMMI